MGSRLSEDGFAGANFGLGRPVAGGRFEVEGFCDGMEGFVSGNSVGIKSEVGLDIVPVSLGEIEDFCDGFRSLRTGYAIGINAELALYGSPIHEYML